MKNQHHTLETVTNTSQLILTSAFLVRLSRSKFIAFSAPCNNSRGLFFIALIKFSVHLAQITIYSVFVFCYNKIQEQQVPGF